MVNNNYFELLKKRANNQVEKKIIEEKIKIMNHEQHLLFVQTHKKTLRIMDSLLILCVLFNIGALVLTNIVVTKNSPETPKFVEMNPLMKDHPLVNSAPILNNQGRAVNFVEHLRVYNALILPVMLWAFLISMYVRSRRRIMSENSIDDLFCYLVILLCMLGYDFLNDLSLYTGLLMR